MIKRISFVVALVIALAGMMVTLIDVHGVTSFNGNVKDDFDDPVNGASIILTDCYFNIIGFTSTNSEGDYSFYATLNGNSPYFLSAGKEGYDSETKVVTGGGSNDFELEIAEKIVVFFWASDCGSQSAINDFKTILEAEGYTKFFEYKDCGDVYGAVQEIDNYERDIDTIFVYIDGHGKYNSYNHYSYTYFKSGMNSKTDSDDFNDHLDNWEANRICILVESCESGYWAYDFAETPYLAMSTSDEYHSSYYYDESPGAGDFSHWFFEHVSDGYNAVQSFYYAWIKITEVQNPRIRDYSSYVWFS